MSRLASVSGHIASTTHHDRGSIFFRLQATCKNNNKADASHLHIIHTPRNFFQFGLHRFKSCLCQHDLISYFFSLVSFHVPWHVNRSHLTALNRDQEQSSKIASREMGRLTA